MERDNKRYSRSYKSKKDVYKKAMRRAKKEKGTLSNLLENVVTCYAYGLDIKAIKIKEGEKAATAIDTFSMNNSEIITAIKQ